MLKMHYVFTGINYCVNMFPATYPSFVLLSDCGLIISVEQNVSV